MHFGIAISAIVDLPNSDAPPPVLVGRRFYEKLSRRPGTCRIHASGNRDRSGPLGHDVKGLGPLLTLAQAEERDGLGVPTFTSVRQTSNAQSVPAVFSAAFV